MSRPIILALDPGITTGWAVIDRSDRMVKGHGVLPPSEIRHWLDTFIRKAHSTGHSITVVVEKMPRAGGLGELAEQLSSVRRDIQAVTTDVYDLPTVRIPPGEWKNSRVAKTAEVDPSVKTPHERDAIRMGLYAADKLLREERRRGK